MKVRRRMPASHCCGGISRSHCWLTAAEKRSAERECQDAKRPIERLVRSGWFTIARASRLLPRPRLSRLRDGGAGSAWPGLGPILPGSVDGRKPERRPRIGRVLLVRESPLHLGHLPAMTQATEIGAIIAPPLPAF